MSVPIDALQEVVTVARNLRAQGYFDRAAAGDERAASLFARLVAYTANPMGKSFSWGWLKKTAGGTNFDGFADGAIVYGNDPADLFNVVKIVTQVGSDHAGIGDAVQPRRESDIWYRPQPLTPTELTYLRPNGAPEPPTPVTPPAPSFGYPDENTVGKAFQERVRKCYSDAGRAFPDPNDLDAFRHFQRFGYSSHEMDAQQAADKHIAELRRDLGLP